MKAFRIEETGDGPRGRLVDLALDDLDPGEVVIRTLYAGVNYKDALAGTGEAPIVRRYPCVGGIEAVGVVETSADPSLSPGDVVIAHGHGLGVSHDGGFAGRVRCPADWTIPLPEGLSPREAAILGVAGHSAALCVDRLERLGIAPGAGPIAVTGATGGVGILSVAMLARRGFEVVAVTSKPDAAAMLRETGASAVIAPPGEPASRPLEATRFPGAVDCAGGPQLAWLLRTTRRNGVIAAVGNAAGVALETTVLPFILRAVSLVGINSDTEREERIRLWARTAGDLKPPGLAAMGRDIPIEALPGYMDDMIAGRIRGRTLVAFPQ